MKRANKADILFFTQGAKLLMSTKGFDQGASFCSWLAEYAIKYRGLPDNDMTVAKAAVIGKALWVDNKRLFKEARKDVAYAMSLILAASTSVDRRIGDPMVVEKATELVS